MEDNAEGRNIENGVLPSTLKDYERFNSEETIGVCFPLISYHEGELVHRPLKKKSTNRIKPYKLSDSPNTQNGNVDISSTTSKLSSSETKIVEDSPSNGSDMFRTVTNTDLPRSDNVWCPKPAIFFNDEKRSVDFVLVWDGCHESAISEEAYQKRNIFEENLRKEGLQLEYEPQARNGLNFVKVHVPQKVLRRYSEILKLRMPMKKELCKLPSRFPPQTRFSSTAAFIREIPGLRKIHTEVTTQWQRFKQAIGIDLEKFPEKSQRFTAIYSRDREYLFDVDSPCFFTPAIHSRIVQFILDRKQFSETLNNDFCFGIERLLNDKVYDSVYPLHDGDLKQPGSIRYLLYYEWSALAKWHRYQPLDYVKEYFGVKISLYFAWLGFYTHMLIPAALVGLGCFLYSWITLYDNYPSEEICNKNFTTKMCPLCDNWCSYWDLKETCGHARVTYLFDNATTVFFAIFMSLWAVLFLELWKRYSAEITHRWDLTGFDVQEEHPRPEYLARLSHVKRKKINVITNTLEPQVPFWSLKVPVTILSFSVVFLLVALALATVVAVVLYRMSVLVALHVYADHVNNSEVILFTICTAATINLIFIVIFNLIYGYVAHCLTEAELLRTQSEFDDSLTLKIYLLQFVNYYGSIFYIAFFKGKFVGSPNKYNRFFSYRQEECGTGGCLIELCIQLAIIMIGKQALTSVLEMLLPLFYKWLNTLKVKTGLTSDDSTKGMRPQWMKDYKLVKWGPRSLFPEYLEMVIQYGFVTIFVAAFPLAPFLALLNNILEMRLDARKLITLYRRPVSQRVKDIGVWYKILDAIGKLAVITNGFIIAFTSEFIPKLVYRFSVSPDFSLKNYVDFSLSYFNTTNLEVGSAPGNNTEQVCRYPDFREPYWSPKAYDRTSMYWHILAARLIFVVIFENVVVLVIIAVKWCIPDIPGDLEDRIRRETFITNEIIIQQETMRAHLSPSQSKQNEFVQNLNASPSTPEQWDRLISKSLSGIDFLSQSFSYPDSDETPTSI